MSNRLRVLSPAILVLTLLSLAACMEQTAPAQNGTGQNDVTKPAPKPTNNPGY